MADSSQIPDSSITMHCKEKWSKKTVVSLPSNTKHWKNGTVQKFPQEMAIIPEIFCFLLGKLTAVATMQTYL